jgi:hypothetical protein
MKPEKTPPCARIAAFSLLFPCAGKRAAGMGNREIFLVTIVFPSPDTYHS